MEANAKSEFEVNVADALAEAPLQHVAHMMLRNSCSEFRVESRERTAERVVIVFHGENVTSATPCIVELGIALQEEFVAMSDNFAPGRRYGATVDVKRLA